MLRVLIPLFYPGQLNDSFVLEATKTADTVFFLEVIEPNSCISASELTERVNLMDEALEKTRERLHRRGVKVVFFKEWGDWQEKIRSTFRREEIDEIVVPADSDLTLKGCKIRRI